MNNKNYRAIEPDKITVGEIVAANYNAAGVFRKFGMDFCCGGGITLQKACKEINTDLKSVLSELQKLNEINVNVDENYQAWEPGYLINHFTYKLSIFWNHFFTTHWTWIDTDEPVHICISDLEQGCEL